VLGIQPVVWAEEEAGPDRPCRLTHTTVGWKQQLISVARLKPLEETSMPTKRIVRMMLLWISRSDQERVVAVAALVSEVGNHCIYPTFRGQNNQCPTYSRGRNC